MLYKITFSYQYGINRKKLENFVSGHFSPLAKIKIEYLENDNFSLSSYLPFENFGQTETIKQMQEKFELITDSYAKEFFTNSYPETLNFDNFVVGRNKFIENLLKY